MLTRLSIAQTTVIALAAAVFASSTVHAQQQSSWDDIVKAAKREGNVTLYSSLVPAALDRLIDGFQKTYPEIKVQNVRITDGVMIARIQQEQATSAAGADLASSNVFDFYEDQLKGDKLVKPVGPNVAKYTGDALPYGLAPVVTSYPMGFAYNTDLVKDPPRVYEDFLKPEYKNAVGTSEAGVSAAVAFWYDSLRKAIPGYWEKLAAQNPALFASSVTTTQAIASGELKGSPFIPPGAVTALQDQGAKIKFVVPDVPSVYGVKYPMVILKNAKNPNAAQVFLNYTLSVDGQKALNGDRMGISEIDGVPGTLPKANIFIFRSNEYSAEQIKTITAEWTRIFKR